MVVTECDVATQYAIWSDLKKEDVQRLQEWLKMQPHIPPVSELKVQLFLHSCYYSNEATKKCIDNFYTVKTHCPEFFANQDPRRKEFANTLNGFLATPMSKLTPEGYGVVYTRLIDFSTDNYHFNEQIKLFTMVSGLWMREVGCLKGHVIVMDMSGGTFGHMTRISLSSLKKLFFFIQEAVPLRLKGIHYVNPVPFMDKVMALLRPFIKKELMEMIFIHNTFDSIHKVFPKDCLPQNIGGLAPPYKELHDNMVKHLCENADILLEEEKNKADESKRPGKPKDSGEVFGVEGTFKKLDID